jgi:hypothetical protein
MSYGTFLMGELARAKNIIDKELEYDLMFETIEAMYKDFNNTTFSLADKSEYDCIVDYLDYIKNNPKLPDEQTPTKLEIVADRIISELNHFAVTKDSDDFGLPMSNDGEMIKIVTNQIRIHLNLDVNGNKM